MMYLSPVYCFYQRLSVFCFRHTFSVYCHNVSINIKKKSVKLQNKTFRQNLNFPVPSVPVFSSPGGAACTALAYSTPAYRQHCHSTPLSRAIPYYSYLHRHHTIYRVNQHIYNRHIYRLAVHMPGGTYAGDIYRHIYRPQKMYLKQ